MSQSINTWLAHRSAPARRRPCVGWGVLVGALLSASTCHGEPTQPPRRFFADDSFWNQPIAADAEVDPRTTRWMKLLAEEPSRTNFIINCEKWTIPLYEVGPETPLTPVGLRPLTAQDQQHWHTRRTHFGHGPGFTGAPIPNSATPDPLDDAHLAIVDWSRNLVWDMWWVSQDAQGRWTSATGMVYPADGPGVFDPQELGLVDGESVHFHGPSRASGVPAVAGLILYDEVAAGEIRHKIAAASRYCAYQEFVYPAIWTDGFVAGGIPEGSVIQLDPGLDLAQFDLTPEEVVVCRALQRYGMVLVDIAEGQPIYAEGLWGHPRKSWRGKLRPVGGLSQIAYRHYRVLKTGPVTRQGDERSKHRPVWGEE